MSKLFFLNSIDYWKSILFYELIFKTIKLNFLHLVLISGFLISFLKKLNLIYIINRIFRNFLNNIPTGILYINKFKRFFLNKRISYNYLSISVSIYSGFNFFLFLDYFVNIVIPKMIKYVHFFLCLLEYNRIFQLLWYDVISRIKDMKIGILSKDNFFYKLNFLKVNYYLLIPVFNLEKIMIILSFWGFNFITNKIVQKFFKTFFFFFHIL